MNFPRLALYPDIFVCPACNGELALEGQDIRCQACRAIFPVDNGIPLLFAPAEGETQHVTEIVNRI